MKNILYILSILLLIFTTNSCYDRDVIDSKDGATMPAVTDLVSSMEPNSNDVTLNWQIPDNISDEIKRPISIYIQVYRGTTLEHQISLANEPLTWTYTLQELDEKYRVVVKASGNLKEKSFGYSDKIYSLGNTVIIN